MPPTNPLVSSFFDQRQANADVTAIPLGTSKILCDLIETNVSLETLIRSCKELCNQT
jgi:hypothetical protein